MVELVDVVVVVGRRVVVVDGRVVVDDGVVVVVADVEVGVVVAVVVVVDSSENSTRLPLRTFPRKLSGSGNLVASCSRVASRMKSRKMRAGKPPPVTRSPRTLVIGRLEPSGNPIQTAVDRCGV